MPESAAKWPKTSETELVLYRPPAAEVPYASAAAPHGAPLSYYFEVIRRQLWKVSCFVVASMVLAFFVSKHLTPLYESTATVHVDPQGSRGIVGDDSLRIREFDPDASYLLK